MSTRPFSVDDDPGTRAYRRWLGRGCVPLAWAALALALVHPPQGLGVEVCPTHATTGVPCPGCGLSRSLSCTLRGDLAAAWSYHAFGPVFAAVFLAIAVAGVVSPLRRRLAAIVVRHPRASDVVYGALVASFLGYGVVRALAYAWVHGLTPGAWG